MLKIFSSFNIVCGIGCIVTLFGANVSQEIITLPRKQLKSEVYDAIQQQCHNMLAQKSGEKRKHLSDRFETWHHQQVMLYNSLSDLWNELSDTIQTDKCINPECSDPTLMARINTHKQVLPLLRKAEFCKKLCHDNPGQPRFLREYQKVKSSCYDIYFETEATPNPRALRAHLNAIAGPLLEEAKKTITAQRKEWPKLKGWKNILKIALHHEIFSRKTIAYFTQLDNHLANNTYEPWATGTVLGQLYETLKGKKKVINTIKKYLSVNKEMITYSNKVRILYRRFHTALVDYIQKSMFTSLAIPPLSHFDIQDYKILTGLSSHLHGVLDHITTLHQQRSINAPPELHAAQSWTSKTLTLLEDRLKDFHGMLQRKCFICRTNLTKKTYFSCPAYEGLKYCSKSCWQKHDDHHCATNPSFPLRKKPCLSSLLALFYDDMSFLTFSSENSEDSVEYTIAGYNPNRRSLKDNFFLKKLLKVHFYDPFTYESYHTKVDDQAQLYYDVLTNTLYLYDPADKWYKEVVYTKVIPDDVVLKHRSGLNPATETKP